MTQDLTIEVHRGRDRQVCKPPPASRGDDSGRRLRRRQGADRHPGAAQDPDRSLQVRRKRDRIFQLKLADTGQSRHAMIREMQVHPITRRSSTSTSCASTCRSGSAFACTSRSTASPTVCAPRALLDFVTREVEVECLPTSIPQEIKVDVSEVRVGQHLEVKDLVLRRG